jgi:hypothetical protein
VGKVFEEYLLPIGAKDAFIRIRNQKYPGACLRG